MTRFLFAFLLLGLVACGNDDEGTGTNCTSSVDQAEVLERYSQILERRISKMNGDAILLENFAKDYLDNATQIELDNLRSQLLVVAEAWLRAEPFAFGPDGSSLVTSEINPFPVDEAAVDSYLDEGGFDASTSTNFERGIPALAYILFNGSATDVHQRLAADDNARNVIEDYAIALQDDIEGLLTAWNDADVTFRTNTGTAAGSSLSVLINAFSKHFEDTRRDRIGTPFGVTTLGFPNPQTVEAPYSGKSLEWLKISIEASQSALFASDLTGNQNLPSLADYLRGLPSADAATLIDDMESQYTLMLSALDEIDGPLEVAVEQDIDDVQEAYNAISRQVVNLKTDVPAVACVAITYVDNPSDSD